MAIQDRPVLYLPSRIIVDRASLQTFFQAIFLRHFGPLAPSLDKKCRLTKMFTCTAPLPLLLLLPRLPLPLVKLHTSNTKTQWVPSLLWTRHKVSPTPSRNDCCNNWCIFLDAWNPPFQHIFKFSCLHLSVCTCT